MKVFKHKKGLATGIIAIMIVIFLTALFSLVSLALWNQFNQTIQDTADDVIAPEAKAQVDSLTSYMQWGDKIFTFMFVMLLASYIITSITLPSDNPVYLIIFFFLLVFTCIIAMFLSNSWAYILQNPNFMEAVGDLPFIDFFMSYLPYIVFVTGIVGGVLFYSRKDSNFIPGGPIDGFE